MTLFKQSINELQDGGFTVNDALDISAEIRALEIRYEVKFSETIYAFFREVTGVDGIETEHVYLSGVNQFVPIEEALGEDYETHLKKNRYFVIGDFDDWCWGYLIDISNVDATPVYIDGGGQQPLKRIADSIEEFIKMSVNSDATLALIDE